MEISSRELTSVSQRAASAVNSRAQQTASSDSSVAIKPTLSSSILRSATLELSRAREDIPAASPCVSGALASLHGRRTSDGSLFFPRRFVGTAIDISYTPPRHFWSVALSARPILSMSPAAIESRARTRNLVAVQLRATVRPCYVSRSREVEAKFAALRGAVAREERVRDRGSPKITTGRTERKRKISRPRLIAVDHM